MASDNEVGVSKNATTTEQSSVVGDAATMREALELLNQLFDSCVLGTNPYMTAEEMDKVDELYFKTKAALSAPPRNCDVGTPREQELRMDEWCHNGNRHCRCGDDGCPNYNMQNNCVFDWLQMPYMKGETDGNK